MRIISGASRGLKLIPPSSANIRPTSDRMRETIFNILSHGPTNLQGARVLDVFAGTGALGLEALSRGAAHATFYDKSRPSLDLVKKNISRMKVEDKTRVKSVSAPLLPRSGQPYDIIFLDPPYNLDVIIETLSALEHKEYMADNCTIIVEYAAENPIVFPSYLKEISNKTYGDARFSFLNRAV